NFSSRGTSDMLLRNMNTGGLQVYDINSNQITGSAFTGTVGVDWQFSGIGNFSKSPAKAISCYATAARADWKSTTSTTTNSRVPSLSARSDWIGSTRVSLPSAPPAHPTWSCATSTPVEPGRASL